MKITRDEKGITLVALIITVVVLLLLAGIAIKSITEFNVVGQANNVATDYKEQQKNENTAIDGYESEAGKYADKQNGGVSGNEVPAGMMRFYINNVAYYAKENAKWNWWAVVGGVNEYGYGLSDNAGSVGRVDGSGLIYSPTLGDYVCGEDQIIPEHRYILKIYS